MLDSDRKLEQPDVRPSPAAPDEGDRALSAVERLKRAVDRFSQAANDAALRRKIQRVVQQEPLPRNEATAMEAPATEPIIPEVETAANASVEPEQPAEVREADPEGEIAQSPVDIAQSAEDATDSIQSLIDEVNELCAEPVDETEPEAAQEEVVVDHAPDAHSEDDSLERAAPAPVVDAADPVADEIEFVGVEEIVAEAAQLDEPIETARIADVPDEPADVAQDPPANEADQASDVAAETSAVTESPDEPAIESVQQTIDEVSDLLDDETGFVVSDDAADAPASEIAEPVEVRAAPIESSPEPVEPDADSSPPTEATEEEPSDAGDTMDVSNPSREMNASEDLEADINALLQQRSQSESSSDVEAEPEVESIEDDVPRTDSMNNDDALESEINSILQGETDESDMNEPQAAAVEPEPIAELVVPEPPKKQDRNYSLREIDEALADDAESLLQGDFESVSEVLDNVFDERAVALNPEEEEELTLKLADGETVVDDTGSGVVTPSIASPPKSAASDAEPESTAPSQDEPQTETVVEEIVEEVAAPDAATEPRADNSEFEDLGAFESVEQVMSEQPEPIAADGADTPEASESIPLPDREAPRADAPASPEPAVAEVEIETICDNAPAGEEVGEAASSAPESSNESRQAGLRAMAARLEPLLIQVLQQMNLPLRYVPPRMRPIVDWLALSLVFWVPIVWVMALFLF